MMHGHKSLKIRVDSSAKLNPRGVQFPLASVYTGFA